MTKEDAISILRNTAWLGSNTDREKVEKAIEILVSISCDHENDDHVAEVSKEDLISRQAVLDALINEWDGMVMSVFGLIKNLPSAQPDEKRTDKRTETHACDCISRQAAIDAARKCSVKEVTPAYMLIDKAEIMTELMMLPSAQPDLSDYADKLWKIAYERGKREAQPERRNCETCRYNSLKWDEEPCDSCTGDHWKPERKTGKWLPCSERLPEDGKFVLVCNDDRKMMIAKYESEMPQWEYKYTSYDWDVWDDQEHGPVKAWMPLPEPWRGEGE